MVSRPISVVINDRALRRPRTGVGQYVYQLLRALPEAAPQHRFVPFFHTYVAHRPPAAEGPVPAGGAAIHGTRKPWLVRRFLQEGYELAFRAASSLAGYDVYHEPNHIPMRWSGPTVTTIHDLSGIRFPQWHPADRVRWYESAFERGLTQTTHFIAVSEFTKGEMVRLLGIASERITVSYQAPRPAFRPRPPQAADTVLSSFGVKRPYLLFVGTLEPRKNLAGLLQAYVRLPARVRRRVPLVIAGGLGWGFGEFLESLRGADVRDSIRLTGFVDDEQLACLYSACHALVWPSLYEGFGLPTLECMACGRPVIVSNTSSLPEVVGEAGLRVNPEDVEAIACAMEWIVDDPALAERLRCRGLARAAEFCWSRCAADHVRVYEACRP